ncbi:hypothetical protein [Granulicella aggregans]|uniref:hypothetical protein n=1 Tax=Granulicella aggregans TaxID=474949 RepID=UPI0021E08564|nr:hypothetical protein [Granulicella aggregans]
MTKRRQSRQYSAILTTAALLAILSPARPVGWGQMQTGAGSSSTLGSGSNRSARNPLDDDMEAHLPESYARMQNTERQRRLVGDTERLLTLTNQLKALIASSGSENLTPEMLRQMDEIEKLARSVKNKMRN